MSRVELLHSDIVTAQLLAIPNKIRIAVEKNAIQQANKIAVGKLRQNAPVETGALRKSFAYDIRTYKGGQVIAGLSGADYKYVGTVTRNSKGKKVFKRNKDAPSKHRRRPAKYIHLVELGTRRGVTATHFVKNTAEQMTATFQQMITDAVEQALS